MVSDCRFLSQFLLYLETPCSHRFIPPCCDSIAANGILLTGSILMFEYGIKPGVGMMGLYFQVEQTEAHVTNNVEHLMYCFYHGLWILPIWVLCYVCSAMWYQDIADNTYKHLKVSIYLSIFVFFFYTANLLVNSFHSSHLNNHLFIRSIRRLIIL